MSMYVAGVPLCSQPHSCVDTKVSRHKYTLEAEYNDTCVNTFAVDICI